MKSQSGMFKDLFSQFQTIYHKVKPFDNSVNAISGYLPPAVYNLPPAVYDQLMLFKAKRNLASVEMAVAVILSEYFGLEEPTNQADTTSRMAVLETKCTDLMETVAELQVAITTLQANSRSSDDNAGEVVVESDSSTPPTEPEPKLVELGEELASKPNHPSSTPMTQAALSRRLGVGTSTISRMQSKPNFSEWSQQKDPEGVAWAKSPDTKLFHPQNDNSL